MNRTRKQTRAILIWVALIFQGVAAQSMRADSLAYRLIDLGVLPGGDEEFGSDAAAVNATGLVVGGSDSSNGRFAFTYSNGVMTSLGTFPNGRGSGAAGVNASGKIVGTADTGQSSTLGPTLHAFIYEDGVFKDLGTLGGSHSDASAINDTDNIVGNASTPGDAAFHAFLYSGGVMHDLGTLGGKYSLANAINNSGQIVGNSQVQLGSGTTHAFLYTTGMADLGGLGGTNSYADAISDAGHIVGASQTVDGKTHACSYAGGGTLDLGTFGGDNSLATGVNDRGDIVGFAQNAEKADRAFIYRGQMYDLKTLVPRGASDGFDHLDRAYAINDSGWIVGSGTTDAGFNHAFLAIPLDPEQFGNISTRLSVGVGENVLIGGFIITGTDPKKVIIRGIGPSLSSFFSNALANPTLELFQGNTLLDTNDDWIERRTEIEATGIPPTNDLEPAIVRTLAPGAYTAIVRGVGDTTGIALVESYDLDQAADSKLANISTRGFVDGGDNVMIGGFIIGNSVGGGATVVVRAIGPALGKFGVAGALQDPTLDLVDANGGTIRSNNDWQDSQRTQIEATGLQPSDIRESAIVETLSPGGYTAIVRGKDNTTGVGLVEVYNVQ